MTTHSAAPAAPHSADALKPCPFCGDEMKIDTGAAGFATGPGEVYVICDCGAMGAGGANQDEAIAAWNRRPTPAPVCATCNDSGIVGHAPDDYFDCPECIKARAEAAAGAVPDGYVLVPVEPPLAMAKAFRDADTSGDRFLDGYAAMLAAAPPAQGLPAAPDDPMDWRLPCDVKVGAGTHKKGTTLRSLVSRMEMLHGMAMKAHPVDEAKAAEFRAFLDQQFGSSPPAAAPSETTLQGVNLEVIRRAYGWTLDADGELLGLTNGDMGYDKTGIKLDGFDLETWKAATAPNQQSEAAPSEAKPFAAPGKWFPTGVLGHPMREYEPGKWESANWPSEAHLFAAAPSEPVAELEELRAENDKLRDALADKVCAATMLTDISLRDGGLNIAYQGGAAQFLAEQFAQQFEGSGAVNYLEVGLTSKKGLRLLVTLQRCDGKTPSQLQREAEAKLAEVLAAPPAQDAGTGDATIVAIGYESGFMATDPDHDGATVKLHYRDEATAEAAFCAITRIIDRAIANSGRT